MDNRERKEATTISFDKIERKTIPLTTILVTIRLETANGWMFQANRSLRLLYLIVLEEAKGGLSTKSQEKTRNKDGSSSCHFL
jgi:hypothetical protein